jgi:hypothetical protein
MTIRVLVATLLCFFVMSGCGLRPTPPTPNATVAADPTPGTLTPVPPEPIEEPQKPILEVGEVRGQTVPSRRPAPENEARVSKEMTETERLLEEDRLAAKREWLERQAARETSEPAAVDEPPQASGLAIDRSAPDGLPPSDEKEDVASPAVRELAESLVVGKTTDFDKAHAIYSWLGHNIAYDVKSLYSGDLSKNSPDEVLQRKMGVCGGYASLFHVMCKSVGLESKYVVGRSRSDDQGLPPNLRDSETNHAWNAVKIDGRWELLDPTWGAGHVTGNKKFVQEPTDEWFLVSPDIFVHSHLPEKKEWQLLQNTLTRAEFDVLPEVKPRFFALGLELLEPKTQPVTCQGEVDFRLRSSQGAWVSAMLFKDKVELDDQSLGILDGDEATVKVRFPDPGEYEVVLIASPPTESLRREVARFKVKAQTASSGGFPKLYGHFSKRQCRILEGFDGDLKPNRGVDFKFHVPGAEELQFKDSGGWTKLKPQTGDIFALNHSPPRGPLKVLAKFPELGNKLPVLLEYDVR